MNLPCASPLADHDTCTARTLYAALLDEPQQHLAEARAFLDRQLQLAARHPDDLPDDPDAWPAWLDDNARRTALGYARYLDERKAGAARRYFRNRAHALHFLQSVAPTKLVDGAWLYGVLAHPGDARLLALQHTYLEELGRGVPAANHVLIYRQLLESLGCGAGLPLSDAHHVQGAVQLALGYLGGHYLPELVGYNLGYELPPLHLPITAYELHELGIDARYFRLHMTIDNASCGHARRALQTLRGLLPANPGERPAFLARVRAGLRLNDAGLSSVGIIDGFDLDAALLAMLERKQPFARYLHSDRSRIQGRSVNQWLAAPEGTAGLLQALQRQGWIRRNADPADSRFWRLIDGPDALMFGVFDAYERQLVHDWIAGSWNAPAPRRSRPLALAGETEGADLTPEEASLRRELHALPPTRRGPRLLPLLAPHRHWTPPGLLATRLYNEGLGVAP